jgi:hypothetical protein
MDNSVLDVSAEIARLEHIAIDALREETGA